MDIELQFIDYSNTQQVVELIVHVASPEYKTKKAREFDAHWTIQMRNLGWQEFSSMLGYRDVAVDEEVSILFRSLIYAYYFKDEPGNMKIDFLEDQIYNDFRQQIQRAFQSTYQLPIDDLGHAIRLASELGLDLAAFRFNIIRTIIDGRVQTETQGIYRKYYQAIGNQAIGWQRLWQEACQRWPSLRDKNIHPPNIPDFIASWVTQSQTLIKSYTG